MIDPDLEEILAGSRSREADVRRSSARRLANHTAIQESRSTLLELMADPDWRVRRAAVDSVLQSGRPEFIPELFQALYDDTNTGKRNAALELLGRFGDEILPLLVPHLDTRNNDVKIFLLGLLADLRAVAHLPFVHECLEHSEPNVVSAAITAVGIMAHPSSIPLLIRFLKDDNVWYHFQAIEAAGEIQDPLLLPYVLPFLESSYCKTTALRALGKFHSAEAYRVLVGSVIQNGRIDRDALQSMQQMFHAPQPEMIRRKEIETIRAICKELLTVAEQRVLAHELPELFDEEDGGRDAGNRNPANAGDGGGNPLLDLKHQDPVIRCQALQNLTQRPAPQFQQLLIASLADEDARARELAAAALRSYKTKEATDALVASLVDQEIWVRAAIYSSLDATDPQVSILLKEKLPQENPICRAMILRRLGTVDDPKDTEVLLSYLNDEDAEIRAAVCEALSNVRSDVAQQCLLERMENDSAWNVRTAALRSLQNNPVPGFEQKLLQRLQSDPDSSVRNAILHLLQERRVNPPDVIFDFLRDPMLANSSAEYLLSCAADREQILQRAESCVPAVRRIVHRIFE